MDKLHDELMKINVWSSIDSDIDNLIEKVIIEQNPELLDDDLCDILNNQRLVDNAKEEIIRRLHE